MTHSEPRKFLFDKSFTKKDMAYKKTFVSPEEVSLAKSVSYQEGYQASQQSLEAINRDQLSAMIREIERLFEEEQERLRLLHHAASKLAQSALKVAFPHYAGKAGVDEVWRTITTCLEKERTASIIKVFVNPLTQESIQNKIKGCDVEEGHLQVNADASLGMSDCRLEWQDSGYERLESVIQSDLLQLLQRLDAQEAADLSDDLSEKDTLTQGETP
ncbi:MAG: hypothetical protein H2057_03490 [Alphaproteobacteria bacterium]|nr:hypothetical protein [Alphaproteobacteria bacterium]